LKLYIISNDFCGKTYTVAQPFHSNAADEVDGATEEDVVERVDELGEEEDVEVAVYGKGPGED
jgi:hypothetical protein